MKLSWITLNVKNMEDSLRFYGQLLGIGILKRFSLGEEIEIAMMGDSDKTKIELIYDKNDTERAIRSGFSIGFEVASADRALKYLKESNIPIKKGPVSPGSDTTFFFTEDPNGIDIQIISGNYVMS